MTVVGLHIAEVRSIRGFPLELIKAVGVIVAHPLGKRLQAQIRQVINLNRKHFGDQWSKSIGHVVAARTICRHGDADSGAEIDNKTLVMSVLN